jgi:hypothetical protein
MHAEAITGPVSVHGVNPVWWSRTSHLRLVDAASGEVLTVTGEQVARTAAGSAIALRPRLGGGAAVVRRGDIALSNFDDLSDLAGVCQLSAVQRHLGAECDPDGGLWLSINPVGLHQLSVGSLRPHPILSTTIATGLAFSADTATLYLADISGAVLAFDYDPIVGLSRRREYLAASGPVSGLCVDAEGGVWTARPGTGRVSRHDSTGILTTVVEAATSNVTGCCFGDPQYRTLFITSSNRGNSPQDVRAGSVFAANPGVEGVPSFGFAG